MMVLGCHAWKEWCEASSCSEEVQLVGARELGRWSNGIPPMTPSDISSPRCATVVRYSAIERLKPTTCYSVWTHLDTALWASESPSRQHLYICCRIREEATSTSKAT